MSITDDQRARVRQELPQITEITDAKLGDLVVEAWAMALAGSSFDAIADIPAVRESLECRSSSTARKPTISAA